MDDRIIDFNDLKNKAKEKDVDKLEDYMYSLYYEMVEGKITMSEFTKKIYKYMEDNNISQDKFLNMQKKLMERYGFDSSIIEDQLKSAGVNFDESKFKYENIKKVMGFQEKYKSGLVNASVSLYKIKNDKNDLEIIIQEENVNIQSEGKVDLSDLELSDFLCSYKKVMQDKPLKVRVCDYRKEYEY